MQPITIQERRCIKMVWHPTFPSYAARMSYSLCWPLYVKQLFRAFMYSFLFNGAFHKTFDKRFPKLVWNSRSSLRTWQFHYVVVNQIVNFETNLWLRWEVNKFNAWEVLAIRWNCLAISSDVVVTSIRNYWYKTLQLNFPRCQPSPA